MPLFCTIKNRYPFVNNFHSLINLLRNWFKVDLDKNISAEIKSCFRDLRCVKIGYQLIPVIGIALGKKFMAFTTN